MTDASIQRNSLALWQGRLNELSKKSGKPDRLNHYVYVLCDPLEGGSVFYVGKGSSDRVVQHLQVADKNIRCNKTGDESDKTVQIKKIWDAGLAVDWHIVCRNLENEDEAFRIEAALISCLNLVHKKQLTNEKQGNSGDQYGIWSPEDIARECAAFVSPKRSFRNIFIFNVGEEFQKEKDAYEATRKFWDVSDKWASIEGCYAVGLVKGISVGAYKIRQWSEKNKNGRREFEKDDTACDELDDLHHRNWNNIIKATKGYYGFGGWLVASFDGRGQFQIKRGLKEKDVWQHCDPQNSTKEGA